jgi:signal transduction histidine kinase/ligand-binding sensor domain-containing protein
MNTRAVQRTTPRAWCCLIGVACLAIAETAVAQRTANWRLYKLSDGLPESACMSVTLAPQGKVVAKHLSVSHVSELDGYSVQVRPAPEAINSRIYQSPAGQLWTVSSEGLLELKDEEWVVHPVPEIAAEFRAGPARIIDPVPIFPVKQGVVIFLLPERLMRFNADDPSQRVELLRPVDQTHLGRFIAMSPSREGGLWIAGTRGLAKIPGPLRALKADTVWQQFTPPEQLKIENLQEPREDAEGTVTTLAESVETRQKIIAHFAAEEWWTSTPPVEKLRQAWRGPDRTEWAASIDSLFQTQEERGVMVESEELSARQYFDLAVEPGGPFWLATSQGLYRYAPALWRAPLPTIKINGPVQNLAADRQGRIWFVSGAALHSITDSQHQRFPFPAGVGKGTPLRSLFALKDGSIWLEFDSRFFRFEPGTQTFAELSRQNNASRFRPLGLAADGSLWVEKPQPDSGTYALELFDGSSFTPVPEKLPARELGEKLSAAFASVAGDLWLSGEKGTARYHDRKWKLFVSHDNTTPEGVLDFAELPDGRIYAATSDKVWEFDGRNWLATYRGFDRINGLLRTRDGSLWIASNSGLHRFFQGAWVENAMEEGLPSAAIRGICEDQRGTLWAGTARGLSVYHPEADPDPPRATIQELAAKDQQFRDGAPVTLTFFGQDRWKYTPRDRLLYSYRLDEQDWTGFSENNRISLTDLTPGKHYFQLRAMDRNCNITAKPAQLEFAVVLPWFKETRLVLVLSAGIMAALFFAGLAYNRHKQLLRSYAAVEEKVALRTRELEMASRELLHSQKMNALGTLSAGIAHDFNNILSIIKGSAQIIEDNLADPKKVRTRVDRIKTVVEQGAGIVKAMLGFSRDSDLQPGQCDLNATVQDTMRLLGDRFLREIEVRFEPGDALPLVDCPRDFVQQILLNFIFNAAEAAGERKQIILASREQPALPPGLVLTPAKADSYLCVSVQDFGCGIQPANLPRIFEPFFTTKALSARRGTGLGLSMVYELAKRMEAGLAVESTVDQGSTFTLIIPVLTANQPQRAAVPL